MTENKHDELEQLLRNSGISNTPAAKSGIKERFEQRLLELNLNQTEALEIMNIEARTLHGLLGGGQKRVDFLAIKKLGLFLGMADTELVSLIIENVEKNNKEDVDELKVRDFILKNFDLVNLKKCGFIDNITDYKEIEKKIVSYFGYDSIFDFGKNSYDVAYSSGKPKPKDKLIRDFWVESCVENLKKINNYYEYDRAALIEYFPNIRWHSINEEKGLYQVIRDLFKLGITVIFEPYMNTLYVRGATFCVKNKPCIVLTNYTDFYPSLWFTLIHELHHVLFDWEDVFINSYHLSGENDLFSMKEEEADNFAREYLYSNDKLKTVTPYIFQHPLIVDNANTNQVHPSLIYIFYCFDNAGSDKRVWGKFRKRIPSIDKTIEALGNNPWQNRKTIKEIANQRKEKQFNNL